MLLDARQFEKILANVAGGRKRIKYQGNGVLLNLEDVRTFGGVFRFYHNSKGEAVSSGAQSQPIRVRNPIRIPEMNAVKVAFHLSLKKNLPKGVVAYMTPTPEMAEAGLIISHQWITKAGDLWASAVALRKIEIETDYPMALLMFTVEQDLSESGGSVPVEEEEMPDDSFLDEGGLPTDDFIGGVTADDDDDDFDFPEEEDEDPKSD